MSALVAIPVILLSISGYMLFPAVKFRVPFNRSPLIGFSCLFVALYFFALLGIGQIGIVFAMIINGILLTISLFLLIRNRPDNSISQILIPAGLFFLLMFFFAFFLRNRVYYRWDELSFWDAFIRSLYVTGGKSPTIIHADYPLGISLIQYYFVSLTKYSHGVIIFAVFSVIFSSILYCCPSLSGKRMIAYPIVFIFSILVLYFNDSSIDTIYIDGLIGFFFAALIFRIFVEQSFNNSFFIELAILFFFFVSLKTSCIVLLCVLFLILLTGDGFLFRKGDSEKQAILIRKNQIAQIAIITVSSVVAVSTWEIRNLIVKPMKIFSTSRLTIENIRILFSPEIVERERKIWNLVLDHLFELDYFSSQTTVLLLVSGLFLIALLIYIIEKSSFSRKFLKLNVVLSLGFAGYVVFLTIFALFVQEPYLGEQLRSFHRYVGSYLIAWSISSFAILLRMSILCPAENSKKLFSLSSVAIFFYVLITSPMDQIFAPLNPEKTTWVEQKAVYQEIVDIIPKGSTVQTIDLGSSGLSCQILNNLFVGHSYIIWEDCNSDALFHVSQSAFADYIDSIGANYILILHGDDYFWQEFSGMFDYPWHGQAFKVVGHGDYRRIPMDQ